MTKRPDGMATAVPNRLPRWASGVAYAVCGWALGGTVGTQTVSPAIVQLARAHDPLVEAALWLSAVLKVLSGIVVLALVQPWGRRIPRWLLLLLAMTGVIRVSTPATLLHWYTFLWGPWWLLGGSLFLATAWSAVRRAPVWRADLVFSALGVGAALVLLVLSGGTIG